MLRLGLSLSLSILQKSLIITRSSRSQWVLSVWQADLSTMESKIEKGMYICLDDFVRDLQLVVDNCKVYNQESTQYHKCALLLEEFFKNRLKIRQFKEWSDLIVLKCLIVQIYWINICIFLKRLLGVFSFLDTFSSKHLLLCHSLSNSIGMLQQFFCAMFDAFFLFLWFYTSDPPSLLDVKSLTQPSKHFSTMNEYSFINCCAFDKYVTPVWLQSIPSFSFGLFRALNLIPFLRQGSIEKGKIFPRN